MNLNFVQAKQLQAGGSLKKPALTREAIREFNNVVNMQHRNEMPNKYNIQTVPHQDLESVISSRITDKYGTEPKSTAKMLLREHLTKSTKNSEQRPFYYANRNDLMSLDEFFKVYKLSEYQREIVEKQMLRERIESNRQKIDELRQTSPSSPRKSTARSPLTTPKQSLDNTSEMFFRAKPSRPASSNVYKQSPPQEPSQDSAETTKNLAVPVKRPGMKARPQTANPITSKPQNIPEEIYEDVYEDTSDADHEIDNVSSLTTMKRHLVSAQSPRELTLTFDSQNPQNTRIYTARPNSALTLLLDQPPKTKSEAFVTRTITSHAPPKKRKKVLNTEPKFTAKEIYRHLAYLTVTPRKLKKNPNSTQIEQLYVGLFRDKKALDKTVDHAMRKNEGNETTRTLPGLLSENVSPHYMQSTNASRLSRRVNTETFIQTAGNTRDGFVSPTSESVYPTHVSTRQEDELYTKSIRDDINEKVHHIDRMLKASEIFKRPESMKSRPQSASSAKTINLKFNKSLSNRIPLRKEIEKKYKMKVILDRNKNLTQRMKEMKGALDEKNQNSQNHVTYDNTNYIHYYHL